MQFLLGKKLPTVLGVGLFVILCLAFMGHRTKTAAGHPHEEWRLSDAFNTVEEVVAFVNDRHTDSFEVIRDNAGFLHVIYEQ